MRISKLLGDLNTDEGVWAVARELLDENGLGNWDCAIDHRPLVRRGQCRYREREIGISAGFIESAPGLLVLDTILHEIAHALCPYHNHDEVWRDTFRRLGGSGRRSDPEKSFTGGRWVATCDHHCGYSYSWQRKPKYNTYRCQCGGTLTVRDGLPEQQAAAKQDVAGLEALIQGRSA